METIITKYHGATNYKGARISATSSSGIRIYISYDYGLDDTELHTKALTALCNKLGWSGVFNHGSLKGGAYVWVCKNSVPTVVPIEIKP